MSTAGVSKQKRIRPSTAVQRKNEVIKKSLVESCTGNSMKTTSIMKKTADHAMHNLMVPGHVSKD